MTPEARQHPTPSEAPLHFRRLRLESGLASARSLGGRLLVPARSRSRPGLAEVPADGPGQFALFDALRCELLSSDSPVLDAWFGSDTLVEDRHGSACWLTDGHWIHGSAQVDPAAVAGGLEAAAHQLYGDVFAALARHGQPHLLRLWNYVPGINDDGAGLEHYRHFNIGRQRAFLDAGQSAFEGSPAACAVGTAGGPLRVFFLAGPHPPIAIENPRQVSAYRYPSQYGPRSPTFSRAAVTDAGAGRRVLFISGTASIQGHQSLHPGDVRMQTEETLLNIFAVLQAADRQAGVDVPATALTLTVYLRREGDLPTVLDVLSRRLGNDSQAVRTAVVLLADICRADLLVEIEAQAMVPSGTLA